MFHSSGPQFLQLLALNFSSVSDHSTCKGQDCCSDGGDNAPHLLWGSLWDPQNSQTFPQNAEVYSCTSPYFIMCCFYNARSVWSWINSKIHPEIILPQASLPLRLGPAMDNPSHGIAFHLPTFLLSLFLGWGRGWQEPRSALGPPFREKAKDREVQNWPLLGVLSVNTSTMTSVLSSSPHCTWKTGPKSSSL